MSIPEVVTKVFNKNEWGLVENQGNIVVDGDRQQTVTFERFEHGGQAMLRVITTIGSQDALSPTRLEAALSLNYSLAHGGLALHGGHLVMTDTFVVADADEGEVESSVEYVAATSDRYEKLIFGTDVY